jgi:hypothetical protein
MTNVYRIDIVSEDSSTLDQRIKDVCDIQYAAGCALVATAHVDQSLILIFQKPMYAGNGQSRYGV